MKRIALLLATFCAGFALYAQQPDRDTESSKAAAKVGPNIGHVIFARLKDSKLNDRVTEHLHFCVFDNGDNDTIYVATRWGMWSNGSLDLSIGGKVVSTLDVPHLLYGGVMIPIGDVFDGPPNPHAMDATEQIAITRISGMIK